MLNRKSTLIIALIATCVVACSVKASAQSLANMAVANSHVVIERSSLGSGSPMQTGYEEATAVYDDLFYAPQYLPGFPTAASIWPRVVDVRCVNEGQMLRCEGYNWLPMMGRGEYLFFRPVVGAGSDVGPVIVPIH